MFIKILSKIYFEDYKFSFKVRILAKLCQKQSADL